jgi:transposase
MSNGLVSCFIPDLDLSDLNLANESDRKIRRKMRPQTPLPDGCEEQLAQLLQKTKDVKEFKRIQTVYLRAKFGYSSSRIATITGYHQTTVKKLQSQYLSEGQRALLRKNKGGRFKENLSVDQEAQFLAPYLEKAASGEILEVSEIFRDYEEKLGRSAGKSTLYAMLNRHGWRKVVPRPKHPKGDPQAQKDFKKTSRHS